MDNASSSQNIRITKIWYVSIKIKFFYMFMKKYRDLAIVLGYFFSVR